MKTTKTEMFALIATAIASTNDEHKVEMLEFIAHEQALLASKAEKAKSSPSKPSKSVQENNAIRERLLSFLSQQEELVTLKDIMEQDEFCDLSTAKLSQLLAPLVKEKKVNKEKVGKVMGYEIIAQ